MADFYFHGVLGQCVTDICTLLQSGCEMNTKLVPCHSNTNTIWPLVFISAQSEFFWLFIDLSEIVSVG